MPPIAKVTEEDEETDVEEDEQSRRQRPGLNVLSLNSLTLTLISHTSIQIIRLLID